jgi:hypothetical protein
MELESNNQMDRLLRRHGRNGDRVPVVTNGDGAGGSHLDADELNAFAANELPAAARGRYLNHLADCGHCRRQVAELASAANPSLASAAGALSAAPASNTIWQRIAGWIKPPTLRFAGPIVAVLCVAAIMGVVLRSQYGTRLLNEHEQLKQPAANPTGGGGVAPNPGGVDSGPGTVAPPAPVASTTPGAPAPPPAEKPSGAPESDAPKINKDETVSRSGEESKPADTLAEKAPQLVPPLTLGGNRGQSKIADPANTQIGQEQRDTGSTVDQTAGPEPRTENRISLPKSLPPPAPTGGMANADDKQAPVTAKKRAPGASGGAASTQATNRAPEPSNQPADRESNRRRGDDDNVAVDGSDRPQLNGRVGPNATVNASRTVLGHTFQRQNGVWVDSGYAAGYDVTNVSRGTEQYRALVADEPGLGTIANQLSGDIIVVWKGRAYRIH